MLRYKIIAIMSLIAFFLSSNFYSQIIEEPEQLKTTNLGGPRLGLTYVLGNGEFYNNLKVNEMDRLVSQFGWHFEYQVSPKSIAGPSFVVQAVPLLGGVEYGKVVPSVTLAFGIRFISGIEFGMGPNLVLTKEGLVSSLVLVGGKSFNYGGVSLPMNLAYVINPDG
ncbi:MAG: hypothetical protein ABFS12_13940, partial [Bacteroidota bacterium]